jgi:epoxyqueuosine reductase
LRDAPIPKQLRSQMGPWLFGCDVCQQVCPWNRKTPRGAEPALVPRDDQIASDAVRLLGFDEEAFKKNFGVTPLSRPRRAGLLRNAAIALGNSGHRKAIPALVKGLNDTEPLIRGASAWALRQIGGDETRVALQSRQSVEDNDQVRDEIKDALQGRDSVQNESQK